MKKSTVVFAFVSCFTVLLAASDCFAGGKAEKQAPLSEARELTIYVVRHGQTIFNLMDKVQGISDGVLTEKGITGAVNMGKGLRGVQFNAVYSSDLKRAVDTACIAMEQNRATKQWEVIEKKELREVSFGVFEGDPNRVMYAAFARYLGLSLPEDAKSIGAATAPIVKYYDSDMKKFLEGLADFNEPPRGKPRGIL
ncbi:MAG: histidine phosphatase family protein [Spirochaetaceae bacterium]|jgi:probable phosphoglycerate mutase|nr:histidine phosphatase family protein [Spirochaetaceae bacterium]